MAAAKGNKYAEKWTEKTVLAKIKEVEEWSKKADCFYIGEALVNCGLYKEIWSDWRKKFADNKKVSQTIKAIDDKIESRLYKAALMGNVVPSVAIFGLKNNNKWTDKQEIEQTGEININITKKVKK